MNEEKSTKVIYLTEAEVDFLERECAERATDAIRSLAKGYDFWHFAENIQVVAQLARDLDYLSQYFVIKESLGEDD